MRSSRYPPPARAHAVLYSHVYSLSKIVPVAPTRSRPAMSNYGKRSRTRASPTGLSGSVTAPWLLRGWLSTPTAPGLA